MASIGITGNPGQLGGCGAGTASIQSYYHCHECDRTVNISTSRIICPNCGGVFLEEFETPPPSPPPSPPSTTLIDPLYFYHNSDSGSDIDLFELLPPPPPFPITTATDRTIFSPPPPPLPPSQSSEWHRFFSQEPDENVSNQYSDILSEISHLPPLPPLPEPFRRPLWRPTITTTTNTTTVIEDSDSETELHTPLPLPPPLPPLLQSTGWEFFYPEEEEEEGPNQDGTSQRFHLPPPPPPPWLQPQPPPEAERLMDIRMTVELLLALDSCQCAVCMEGFELNQFVKQTPCKHTYHSACILPWLDLQKTCPVCRYQLPLPIQ